MSYGVYLYSPSDELPDLRRVQRNLLLNGWASHFRDAASGIGRVAGAVANSTVFGWPAQSARFAEARDAVASADDGHVMTLLQQEAITSCALTIIRPYSLSGEATSDELREMREEAGPRNFTAMQRARTHYAFESSHGSNPLAVPFQLVLAALFAALCGGLVEDPQSGTFSHRTVRRPRG
ncbi:MAG: hypothetical protein LC118_07060 [Dehalococcoidia bacterium]|nr:hypothetical protein [Dehalococcoidia bacterium]